MASVNDALRLPEGFEVTRDGKVYSMRRGSRRELKQSLDNSGNGYGYPSVRLSVGKKQTRYAVHRLVALVYLPPRPSAKHFILHCDGNKNNPAADNLRWGTASENNYDAWRHRRERENFALPINDEEVPF